MRSFRGFAFLAVGLLGVIPSVHIMMLPEINEFKTTIVFCLLMGLSYICGVLIYVSRIPERFYPGRFDIWGHSH